MELELVELELNWNRPKSGPIMCTNFKNHYC